MEEQAQAKLVCPICNHLNEPDATLCEVCSSVLQPETRRIQASEDIVSRPKFGKTEIERNLFLHIRGSNEPIQIILEEREMIIGRYDPTTGQAPEVDLYKYDAEKKAYRAAMPVFLT